MRDLELKTSYNVLNSKTKRIESITPLKRNKKSYRISLARETWGYKYPEYTLWFEDDGKAYILDPYNKKVYFEFVSEEEIEEVRRKEKLEELNKSKIKIENEISILKKEINYKEKRLKEETEKQSKIIEEIKKISKEGDKDGIFNEKN